MPSTSFTRRLCAKLFRFAAYSTMATGGAAVVADVATDHSVSRSLRAIFGFAKICYKYKTTTPETPEELFALHQYSAGIVLDVCMKNEGLYIKLGQGLNAMSHVLPREYTDTLKVLLDNAPPVPMADIRNIIYEETGKRIEDLFVAFDEAPIASASIAQVHQAWLAVPSSSGDSTVVRKVAVKVRKPSIAKQAVWDLYTYEFLLIMMEQLFGLPTSWSRRTVVDSLRREMDFTLEAANAERFAHNFRNNEQVYVPRIIQPYTSKRLLLMEWIDGTKLLDTETIRANFDARRVLTTLFDAFGDMVFKHGFVHCDLHAANVLVRPLPLSREASATLWWQGWWGAKARDHQVVLLDFGLALPETERFRMEYALLFKSLFTHDNNTLRQVVQSWGIGDAESFASLQAQKPYSSIKAGEYSEVTKEEVRLMQRRAHAQIKTVLKDAARIPRELPMVGRGMDILRGINRLYGSPINRVNMFVKSAVQCLGPLHSMEGVELYLSRLQGIIMARNGAQIASSGSEAVVTDVAKDRSAAFSSVFDAEAEAFRLEQAAAVAEVEYANENKFFLWHVWIWAETVYRRCVFECMLLFFHAMHMWTRTYNYMLSIVAPPSVQESLHLITLDERMERRMGGT